MLIFKLIIKNIFAHKIRSRVIFSLITLVILAVFLLLAFSDGELENFREGTLALLSPSADIAAHQKTYVKAKERNEKLKDQIPLTIKDYPALREKLFREFPYIRTIYHNTKSIQANLFIKGKKFSNINFRGVDMYDSEYITSRISMKEGNFFKQNDKLLILLNSNVKLKLNAEVGDTITIVGRDLFGQAIAQDVVVKGFYISNNNTPILNSLALVDMNTYYIISGYYKGEALGVNINLKRGYSIKKVLSELNQWASVNIPEIGFFNYMMIHPENVEEYKTIRIIIISICIVVFFIVNFGIMNVISVNLLDRKKEIGTYYCLGVERYFLKWLYTTEILILNLAATICGILLGLLIRFLINAAQITTTKQSMQLVFGGNILKIGLNPFSIFWILVGIFVVTIITAVLSLGRNLKISPIAAIREVKE